MNFIFPFLIILGPLILLSAILLPSKVANHHMKSVIKIVQTLTFMTSLLAVGTVLSILLKSFIQSAHITLLLPAKGPFGYGIYFDALSAIMFFLVSFIGTIVARYSGNYLDGDPNQGKFFKWLSFVIGSVLLLIMAGNMLLLVAAWMATSIGLHQLLTFYSNRPAAILAARKKLIFTRIADICIIGATVLMYLRFHSFDISEILRLARATMPQEVEWSLTSISFLLVSSAIIKSAQFPFHSWLPDTMETPTPVSALMHAGIINAGGFLVVRLSPIICLTPLALDVLSIIGAITAIFASLVMLTQTNIKKYLAFSTVAQMGFMLLECGLGAFSIAILHLVAHSLYKAYSFLSSGSMIALTRSIWIPLAERKPHPILLVFLLIFSLIVALFISLVSDISILQDPGAVVLNTVLIMALTQLIWNSFEGRFSFRVVLSCITLSTVLFLGYFFLHYISDVVLNNVLPSEILSIGSSHPILISSLIVLFIVVFLLQSSLQYLQKYRWCQILYVHIYNRLYINAFVNRLLLLMRPIYPKN